MRVLERGLTNPRVERLGTRDVVVAPPAHPRLILAHPLVIVLRPSSASASLSSFADCKSPLASQHADVAPAPWCAPQVRATIACQPRVTHVVLVLSPLLLSPLKLQALSLHLKSRCGRLVDAPSLGNATKTCTSITVNTRRARCLVPDWPDHAPPNSPLTCIFPLFSCSAQPPSIH